MTKCVCPICGKELGSLNMHVVYTHHMSIVEFRKLYPNVKMQQQTEANFVKCTCPICGKEYNTKNGLGTHLAYSHKNVKRNDIKNKIKKTCKEGYICPICNKETTNISQHVLLTHKLEWDDFCKKYDWKGMKKYVSEEAHANLSINKKAFYDSDRGFALKQIQSEKMKGKNNIVYLPGVRDKLVNNTSENGLSAHTGYGISMRLKNGIYLRSFNEFVIYSFLKEKNIDFEYENLQIRYEYKNNWHTYFADFVINNVIYELKAYTMIKINEQKYKFADKYHIIKEYANKAGYDFELVNPTMLLKKYNIEYSGGKTSLKERRDKLFEYMKNGQIEYLYINKGLSMIKTFIEQEERWKQFANITINKRGN